MMAAEVLAFRIALDSTEDTIYVEQWRSSDHDRITLRGRTGELDGVPAGPHAAGKFGSESGRNRLPRIFLQLCFNARWYYFL